MTDTALVTQGLPGGAPGGPTPPRRRALDSSASWRLTDRIGLGISWALGLMFCAVTVAIVVFFLIKGIQYVRPSMLVTNPKPGDTQSQTGGFFAPLAGTVITAVLAMAIALPVGVGVAVWLSEYARPAALARIAESTIEMLAGAPSIVLALFGVLIFEQPAIGFLSQTTNGIVVGESFFAASIILSLVALPLVVANVREGLQAIPSHVREASYAVGKTKIATTRRVLLPAARTNVVTGAMLGVGRVIGDTAIILWLLGAALSFQPASGFLGLLRGEGSTLTSFIYNNAPSGEYNQPQKAYAATFVLLLMVLALNVAVEFVGRRSRRMGWS
jgi:phosphate transport system permease protein